MNKALGYSAAGIAGGVIWLLWSHGLQMLVGYSWGVSQATDSGMQRLQVIEVDGTPRSGRVSFSLDSDLIPRGWLLAWDWCPRLNLWQWCVSMRADGVSVTALVAPTYRGVHVYDGEWDMPLPTLALPVEGRWKARIHSAYWQVKTDAFLLQQLTRLDLDAEMQDLSVFGVALQPVQVAVSREPEQVLLIQFRGAEVNGGIDLSGDYRYRLQLSLTPPAALGSLLSGGPGGLSVGIWGSELQRQSEGRFMLKTMGAIPVSQRW